MNKKRIIIIFIIALLLLAAGIIAVSQEPPLGAPGTEYFDDTELEYDSETDNEELLFNEEEVPPYYGYIYLREIPGWVRPIRWFKSNAGGLIIEEMPSKMIALRNEYAMSIEYTHPDDLPNELLSFYNENFLIETRILYNKGKPDKSQWVFRDYDGVVMLISVFSEEDHSNDHRTGFIEVYDEEGFITREYNYLANNENNRIEYVFSDNILTSSTVYNWVETRTPRVTIIEEEEIEELDVNSEQLEMSSEELAVNIEQSEGNNEESEDNSEEAALEIQYDITGEYKIAFTDTFIYNRSGFLRMVERKYHSDKEITPEDEPVRLSLPSSIKKAQENKFSSGARYNSLPEFFGAMTVREDYKMVYTTDDRSRILTQTLYDNDENIIWTIENTWQDDRIIVSVKTEGDIRLTSEYEYNSSGDRILERNLRNGNLERLVRAEGKTEIEELYMDNIIVLRAVWEDGRKITETRVRNN